MSEQTDKLKQFIDASNSILITSHISSDPDAACSSLLLARTLAVNYPDKKISLTLEEHPVPDLDFLEGYDSIEFGSLADALISQKPQLLIMVDANQYKRCSRDNPAKIIDLVSKNNVVTAIIDHHEPAGREETDVFIHNNNPAATQDVYELCFQHWNLSKPTGYAQITMVGILNDTFRFKYNNPRHKETFAIVSELIEAGADIEALENRLEHYTADQLKVVGHLAKSLVIARGYNYSFISDNFTKDWKDNNKSLNDYKSGVDTFVNQYVRNAGDNKWGFVVYEDFSAPNKTYSVSLRSEGNAMDVSIIATNLGGGGHKSAAGAKIQANSVEEVVSRVKTAVENLATS